MRKFTEHTQAGYIRAVHMHSSADRPIPLRPKSFGASNFIWYRFNRRFDLADLVGRHFVDVYRDKAAPERVIRHA